MDYSEATFDKGTTEQVICKRCGSQTHNIFGVIKSLFFLLEFVPFVPVKSEVFIVCRDCCQRIDEKNIEPTVVIDLKKRVFTLPIRLSRYIGLLLFTSILFFWLFNINQENKLTNEYIAAPKINDFYFLDLSLLPKSSTHQEPFRLAKVVDITSSVVSLIYSGMAYSRKSSLENTMRSGQILAARYFGLKRYDFTLEQLQHMEQTGAVIKVKRAVNNWLYGMVVINPISLPSNKAIHLGPRHNNIGLAFLQSTYLKDYHQQAFKHFSQSAAHDYARGQLNLAKMYLSGQYQGQPNKPNLEKALFWFKESALHANKAAIEKYTIVCRKVSNCQVSEFYQELIVAGVNLRIN